MRKIVLAAIVAQILISGVAEAIEIVDAPIIWTEKRERLTRE